MELLLPTLESRQFNFTITNAYLRIVCLFLNIISIISKDIFNNSLVYIARLYTQKKDFEEINKIERMERIREFTERGNYSVLYPLGLSHGTFPLKDKKEVEIEKRNSSPFSKMTIILELFVLSVTLLPIKGIIIPCGNTEYDLAILMIPLVLLKIYFTVELISKFTFLTDNYARSLWKLYDITPSNLLMFK